MKFFSCYDTFKTSIFIKTNKLTRWLDLFHPNFKGLRGWPLLAYSLAGVGIKSLITSEAWSNSHIPHITQLHLLPLQASMTNVSWLVGSFLISRKSNSRRLWRKILSIVTNGKCCLYALASSDPYSKVLYVFYLGNNSDWTRGRSRYLFMFVWRYLNFKLHQ